MNKPAKNFRIGRIAAAIWANTNEYGVFYNVTFERRYKDGEEWKSSGSFNRDDLLVLAKVADLAHTWIVHALQQPDGRAAPTTPSPPVASGPHESPATQQPAAVPPDDDIIPF